MLTPLRTLRGVQTIIRHYRDHDLDAIYDLCVRTADAGGDARGQFSDDRLLGDVWAAPYVTLEPDVARVLDDGDGNAVGYIVGTADTPTFVRRFREEWIPAVAGRYDGSDPRDQSLIALLHHPERMLVPELADFPAHLHIDILPPWQGSGRGRALMTAFLAGLHEKGVTGVHLGVSPTNTAAQAFYDRLGFTEVAVPGERHVIYLARPTA
jgi:ribosomal protein S18 acetylase RimI-like enzyme